MRLCSKCLVINDQYTHAGRCLVPNRQLTLALAIVQLLITVSSLCQHFLSVVRYRTVFRCAYAYNSTVALDDRTCFLSFDIIVFDYGFFHLLLGTDQCIANYLDGGYLRFTWCFFHTVSLALLVNVCCCRRPCTLLMRPALFMQSIYALGLVILALATLPKTLSMLINQLSSRLFYLTVIYYMGLSVNWCFTLVLWHLFWHLRSSLKTTKAAARTTLTIRRNSAVNRKSFLLSNDVAPMVALEPSRASLS
ncbi:unnamed protein product [Soboliphyme baturini]|uniref:G protein-coupled receptor n=1 Tax=Soboliphyme baturini TaxID=241478 RepID=A0A183IC62_9BILA|nr:unnamed protein product [Soboliphyme baturini]